MTDGDSEEQLRERRRLRKGSTASVTSVVDPADDLREGDELARQSDATVGGAAVPPETEYFGFALYVGSSFIALVYLLWAYLPASWLKSLDISFFPSRWWALAIPAYTVMLLIYIYVALALYNTEVLTVPPTSLTTITDVQAKVPNAEDAYKYLWQGTDGVWDLPLGLVCEVLYSESHDSESQSGI